MKLDTRLAKFAIEQNQAISLLALAVAQAGPDVSTRVAEILRATLVEIDVSHPDYEPICEALNRLSAANEVSNEFESETVNVRIAE